MIDRRKVLKTAAAAAMGAAMPRGAEAGPATTREPRLVVRRAGERGHVNHGWLDTWHTFSFASYHDPRHMGYRSLRVINEDRVSAGTGFPMHPHQDMEILTYVLQGALQHKDSMGNGSVIVPGEVQRMSAGTGIRHSEYNPSRNEPVHLLQIWILPDRVGVRPSYAQKPFPEAERRGALRLVASRDGRNGSLPIHQDADLFAALLAPEQEVRHDVRPGRGAWLQVARGEVQVGNVVLAAGDAASTDDPGTLVIRGRQPSEVLLFDLV